MWITNLQETEKSSFANIYMSYVIAYIFLPELASSFSIFCMVNTHDFLYLSVFANSTLYFAKLSQISTSTKLGWSLVLFLNNPTHPTPRNSKDYTFQEAEIWHASSNGPNKMKYEVKKNCTSYPKLNLLGVIARKSLNVRKSLNARKSLN